MEKIEFMEIWLDTSDVTIVAEAKNLGILDGVTTNPTIMASSKISPQDLIKELLAVQDGFVAVQVLSDDVEEMKNQAKMLSNLSNRILIKIPVTKNGLQVLSLLNREGIPTLATAIFDLRQALFAFKAGALYLAPYLGRIADSGKDPIEVLSKMQALKKDYGFEGKIMGAGIRDVSSALACVELGISAITLSDKIFAEFTADSEHTLKALQKFSTDWSNSPHKYSNF